MESCERALLFDRSTPGRVRWAFLCLASTSASKLSAVLRGPGHFGDWHVDDAAGNKLARLSTDRLRSVAGTGGVLRADTDFLARAICRSLDRPAEPASPAAGNPGSGHVSVARPGCAYAHKAHQCSRNRFLERVPRCNQRV